MKDDCARGRLLSQVQSHDPATWSCHSFATRLTGPKNDPQMRPLRNLILRGQLFQLGNHNSGHTTPASHIQDRLDHLQSKRYLAHSRTLTSSGQQTPPSYRSQEPMLLQPLAHRLPHPATASPEFRKTASHSLLRHNRLSRVPKNCFSQPPASHPPLPNPEKLFLTACCVTTSSPES